MPQNVMLLDCTLRDGGYYTEWDFDELLVKDYFESMNHLPADFLEIGYRSVPKNEYAGAFFYLPDSVLKKCGKLSNKKLSIILNEKEITTGDLPALLNPCKGIIAMVRLAVQPERFDQAVALAQEVKKMGFLVAFNLMYASIWKESFQLDNKLKKLNSAVDYFYVVDSYGGLFPAEVIEIFNKLKDFLTIPLGYHGHDNLEMALANSLAALHSGAQIIDSTVCGMGRGAGNLKTELFYTVLHQQNNLEVNFDFLNTIVSGFENLKERYKWGTNLPYMVSGAFSMPQNKVFGQVKKRYYSINSIINKETGEDRFITSAKSDFPDVTALKKEAKEALLVGGGDTPGKFAEQIIEFLNSNPEIPVLFSSSRNAAIFDSVKNLKIHFLPGMESRRLEKTIPDIALENRIFVVPESSSAKSAYLPEKFKEKVFSIKSAEQQEKEVSSTSECLKIAELLRVKNIYITGYDGYEGEATRQEIELFEENQQIFDEFGKSGQQLFAITPTQYNLSSKSIFLLLSCL